MKNNKTVLIVAAHPDDEVLGAFATVAKLIAQGYEAYTLILSQGIAARENVNVETKRAVLKKQIEKANATIGVKQVFLENFPDNRFDSVDLLDIVKTITRIKEQIKPDIIFTHYENDLNIDHTLTYKAVLTATRPMENETVKEVYSFEILSSTEWNYPLSFSPDVFFDVEETIELKLKAMQEYQLELREYPHPRSLEGIKLNAHYQGMRVGKKAIEAFKLVRSIR